MEDVFMDTMVQLMYKNTEIQRKYMKLQRDFMALEGENVKLIFKVEQLEHELKLIDEQGNIYELMAKVEFLENEKRKLTEEVKKRRKADGRPQKLNWKDRELIREKRIEGWSIQRLANSFDCSKTTIQKIVKGIEVDLRKSST